MNGVFQTLVLAGLLLLIVLVAVATVVICPPLAAQQRDRILPRTATDRRLASSGAALTGPAIRQEAEAGNGVGSEASRVPGRVADGLRPVGPR